MSETLPQSTDQLKRALEAGECFVWRYYNRHLYFEWVDGVGAVYTETDAHDQDPFTTAANEDKLKTALTHGGVEWIEHDEIPKGDGDG